MIEMAEAFRSSEEESFKKKIAALGERSIAALIKLRTEQAETRRGRRLSKNESAEDVYDNEIENIHEDLVLLQEINSLFNFIKPKGD